MTEISFGTYRPPPLPKKVAAPSEVIELREKIAFLTSQLVNRERALQGEKDEFMARISLVSFERVSKLQEELEASKAEILQLRSTLAAPVAAPVAAAEAAVKSEAETEAGAPRSNHLDPTSPQLPTTPRRDAETSSAEEELRRRVVDLETRLITSREDIASARETLCARDEEIKKLSETAKRLSEALRQRAGETEMLKKDLADEQAFSQGLGANKAALEEHLDEAHKLLTALTHERNEAGRDARLMAQELMALRPTAVEYEVWQLWVETEIRTMTRVGKELGTDAFSKAAFQFVKKYKNGEAVDWVSNVVTNRNAALERAYGSAPRSPDAEPPNEMKVMYVVNKTAMSGDGCIPQVVAVPSNAQK
jgi:chromosome segregation ATPase